MRSKSIKRYLIPGAIILIAVIGGIFWYLATSNAPSFSALTVGRGNVVESVDQAGNIIAENNVQVSFQEAGQIAAVYATEGGSVPMGTTLAALDQSSLKAATDQANAALAAAQAKLDGLTSGTRPEQLQIDNAAVTNAQASLEATLGSAYAAADDAVRNKIDSMFSTPGSNPIFLVPDNDSQGVIDLQAKRQTVEAALKQWYAAGDAASADSALGQVGTFLNMVAIPVNQALISSALPAATLTQYKLDVSTARTEVTAAASALTAAEAALVNAQNKVLLDKAGSSPQDIEAQKAVVAQAQAAAASAQVAVDHAVLTAPFAGVVQNLTAKVGQVVTPGTPMLSLVNNSGLKIEIYVSQTDVAKIKEGEKADITADAYGAGTIFPATVTTVGITETAVNGTSAYKVTLHFVNPDGRLKDGMTANVRIVTAEHDNVLEIPSRLVVTDNADNFVLVANGGATERRKIQTGITGDDGMTEVVSGLNAGDQIINF